MLRRAFITFFSIALGIGLYNLGFWQGRQVQLDTALEKAAVAAELVADALATPSEQRSNRLAEPSTDSDHDFNKLLDSGAWYQLERWLVEHAGELTQSHGQRLNKTLAAKINKYDAVAMRRVLRAYLQALADDADVLFLFSDLQQMGGMREAALETLFTVLDYPRDQLIAQRARQGADQIVVVIDLELKSRGALAEREAFWRHLSTRLSSSDYYRYQWARVLADLKRWEEAKRVLAETGSSDIAQANLDELLKQIKVAERGVQFERDGDRLLSAVTTPEGLTFTLLVDTGANVTSLSKRVLRSIAAVRQKPEVRVQTAAGIVTTWMYRVAELEVQGRIFTDLRVLELPVDVPEVDGLLGLDILDQLGSDPLSISPI